MPDHQTELDAQNEERIATEWAANHGCRAVLIAADKPRIDRALIGPTDQLVGFAEVKTCNWPFAAASFGGGYKIGVDKRSAAAEAGFAFSLPVYLVVEFTDALAWLDINMTPCQRGHQIQRRDRGTVVNAVMFAWQQFTIDRAEPYAAMA